MNEHHPCHKISGEVAKRYNGNGNQDGAQIHMIKMYMTQQFHYRAPPWKNTFWVDTTTEVLPSGVIKHGWLESSQTEWRKTTP